MSRFLPGFYVVFIALAAGLRAQSTVPALQAAIPSQAIAPGGAVTIDLRNYIGVSSVSGQIVQFDTVLGKFNVELLSNAAPRNVANFLSYVQAGLYANSFIHRTDALDSSGAIAIAQGGGFYAPNASGVVQPVPTFGPVPLEYNLPNVRGTLAAARTSDINSATSQFYFNTRDNSSILGQGNGGGYTVFGRVIGSGMTVVDAMAALPRVDAGTATDRTFSTLPVINYPGSGVPAATNLVIITSVTPISLYPGNGDKSVLAFTAQSSASNVVSAAISGSTLTLNAAANGNAVITVHTTDTDGNAVDALINVAVTTASPSFSAQPISQTVAAGGSLVLNAPAAGAATYTWRLNGTPIPGATSAMLVIKDATAANAGAYTSTATNASGSVTSEAATIAVAASTDAGRLINLSILAQLAPSEVMTMGTVLGGAGTTGTKPLLARAAGPSLAQLGVGGFLADPTMTLSSTDNSPAIVVGTNNDWAGSAVLSSAFNQVGAFAYASADSKDAAVFQNGATALAPGKYTVQVSSVDASSSGTVIAELYDATPSAAFTAATPRLINVSVLKQIAANSSLTAGFVIGGSTSRTVLIRAVGPSLTPFGVGGAMTDPTLELHADQTLIGQNNDWGGDAAIASAITGAGAFSLSGAGSKDAVILATLPPGAYTATVKATDGAAGAALVEVYEVP